MASEFILQSKEEGVLLLTFNRPERKNAFNAQMWRELSDALSAAKEDDEVRVLVVTGAGTAFSAGADLTEMAAPPSGVASAGEHPFAHCVDVLRGFDKPTVAAVNGVGIGGGLTLLLFFDYVYIARGARLRAPFVTLGVAPEAASSYMLPALLGYRPALHMLYESEFIDAERACELGIATQLCEPEELMEKATERAKWLARKPLGSLRWCKRLLLATRDDQVRAAQARENAAFASRVGSPENVEAIKAFFEKRDADFSGISPADKQSD